VILKGVVNNELERNIAIIQANSVPGVFSVTDDLAVPMKEAEKILKTK
jgi:osmotically-inducible protein OsmY